MSGKSTRRSSSKQGQSTTKIRMADAFDPENPPLTEQECAEMRRVPLVALVRERLGLSREQFAAAYGIPIDALKAWERRTAEPTETEAAYLRLIQRNPAAARLVPAEAAP